jgi:hypothetical protein
MFNKFQQTIIKILENNTVSGVLGQSLEPLYNPPSDIKNNDNYAIKDMRTPKLLGKKIIKRKFPELLTKKNKKNKK